VSFAREQKKNFPPPPTKTALLQSEISTQMRGKRLYGYAYGMF